MTRVPEPGKEKPQPQLLLHLLCFIAHRLRQKKPLTRATSWRQDILSAA